MYIPLPFCLPVVSTKTSLSITVRAYSSPTLMLNVARCKSASDLTEDDEGTKVKISAAGSITDVLNSSSFHVNTMYAKTRFRTSPSGTWSSLTNLSGGVSGYSFDKTGSNSVNLAGDFPTTSKYDIELYVYDTVTLAESGWSGSGTAEQGLAGWGEAGSFPHRTSCHQPGIRIYPAESR